EQKAIPARIAIRYVDVLKNHAKNLCIPTLRRPAEQLLRDRSFAEAIVRKRSVAVFLEQFPGEVKTTVESRHRRPRLPAVPLQQPDHLLIALSVRPGRRRPT